MRRERNAVPRALILVAAVFVVGTVGYRLIEGSSWWDAFFMTVITVTTVGFSEEIPLSEPGELFTALLLFAGFGVLLFLVTETSRSVLEDELRRFVGRVRRSRMIDRVTGHEIVCGYGRMGRSVVEELQRSRRGVVVVEQNTDQAREAEELGVATIVGDATSDAVLQAANIKKAHGLVACLSDDAHNVYTVITARSLKADLLIVARATKDSACDRIVRAGADRVVNPYQLGGFRLAHLVVKPTIVNFFDASLGSSDLQLDQSSLRSSSPVVRSNAGRGGFPPPLGALGGCDSTRGEGRLQPGPGFSTTNRRRGRRVWRECTDCPVRRKVRRRVIVRSLDMLRSFVDCVRVVTIIAVATALAHSVGHAQLSNEFVPVTDAMIQAPASQNWLTWRRTLDGWGYSPLDEIDGDNVNTLRLVWSRALGPGSQQGTPLVYNGVMYMPNPKDVIQALDAASGDLKWEYRRQWPDDAGEFLLAGLMDVNRNIAIYDNLIIDTSADDYIFALDATSGRITWETQILDYRVNPAHQTSGPIIANGKVISGRGCLPKGGPDTCVITAHDARTGTELWRRRTIPAPGEPGDETWGGVPFEDRKHVGTWMVPSYDPELNLIYIGTSVTSPAPKFLLGGTDKAHLYHNCTLALDADTGEIRWYYQHLNDHWDLDHPFERMLVDTTVAPDPEAVNWINPRIQAGEVRKVITGIPGKTGVVYTLDRETGEFLWATPTIAQNVINGINGATGAVTENAEVVFTGLGQEVLACPTWDGGKDWEAGAYSPLTHTMYFSLRNTCARMLSTANVEGERELALTAGGQAPLEIYALAARHQIAPGTDQLGTVRAISVETGETTWLHEQRAATMSLVATGGGLIFGGDVNGRFRAFDQDTGEVLWEVNLGSPVTGFPISYGVGGRQYVAVSTGSGASIKLRLTPELRPSFGNNLFVFALPDRN